MAKFNENIDELGRFIIPQKLKNKLDNQKQIDLYTEGNYIILKKHEKACIFCKKSINLILFKEKYICYNCMNKLVRKFIIK